MNSSRPHALPCTIHQREHIPLILFDEFALWFTGGRKDEQNASSRTGRSGIASGHGIATDTGDSLHVSCCANIAAKHKGTVEVFRHFVILVNGGRRYWSSLPYLTNFWR
ncbi:hypothetical protein D3C76_910200 [compost metagenome]